MKLNNLLFVSQRGDDHYPSASSTTSILRRFCHSKPERSVPSSAWYRSSIFFRPLEAFAQIVRVLKPGGVLAVTFSNRWFPPKVIKV
jgi:SAM-dependent methyltransferase